MSAQPQAKSVAAPAPPCAVPPDSHRWWKEEVQPHEANLKAYLHNAFPSVRDVEDVVQETLFRTWRHRLSNPIQEARSFLYKVAQRLAIDDLRRRKRSPIDAIEDLSSLTVLDGKPNAADTACTNEELDLLVLAIESLPARCREIVILRKLRGLSQKEIADRLGIAEHTVEVQGSKGLDRIEIFLREHGVTR